MTDNRKYQHYTQNEDNLLRKGATSLPGRTQKAVYQRRRELGLVKSSRWTKDQIELAKRNIVPEGRTKAALRMIRHKLGLKKNVSMTDSGQLELNLTPLSEHHNTHIHTIVGNFVKTILILKNGGMTVAEIAEQTGKPVETVQTLLNIVETFRLKH
jgi:hypothetical protein